ATVSGAPDRLRQSAGGAAFLSSSEFLCVQVGFGTYFKERQNHRDTGPVARFTIDIHFTAQFANVLGAFVGANTHARLFGTLKRLEKSLANELGTHAMTGVADFQS